MNARRIVIGIVIIALLAIGYYLCQKGMTSINQYQSRMAQVEDKLDTRHIGGGR